MKNELLAVALSALAAAGIAAPAVDGVIGEAEWRDAAVYCGLTVSGKDEAYPAAVKVWTLADATNAYVAMRSPVQPDGLLRFVRPRDDRSKSSLAFLDDAVVLTVDGQRVFVNARGAWAADAWDGSCLRTASSVTNGSWNIEIACPRKRIRNLASVRIGRRFACGSAEFGPLAELVTAGSAFPEPGKPVVQILDVTGGEVSYVAQVRLVNPWTVPVAGRFSLEGHPQDSQPIVLMRDVSLRPGDRLDLDLKGAILGDEPVRFVSAARTWTLRPNFKGSVFARSRGASDSVSYKFAYYPSYNKLHARVDVNLIPDWKRDVKGVTCELFDVNTNRVFVKTLSVGANGLAEKIFDIPDLRPLTVRSGNPLYRIRMTVDGLDGIRYEKRFYRHALDWEGNREGLSETVVAPFEAMAVDEGGRFSSPRVRTVLREHELNSMGLFRQVRCPAREGSAEPVRPILAGEGVRLLATVDGKTFEVRGKLRFEPSESPVRRVFHADFSEGGLSGRVTGVFEYDGQLDWRLTLERGTVDALRLEVPMAANEGRLLHTCIDDLRRNYGGEVPAGTGKVWDGSHQIGRWGLIGDYVPYIWIGGPLRGLAVYGNNDRGWVWGEYGARCQEIFREKDGMVRLVLNLINRPFAVTTPRTIRIGFMATPVKPMLPDWRERDLGFLIGSGNQWGAAPQDADVEPFDGTDEFWRKMAEARKTGKVDKDYVEDALRRIPCRERPEVLKRMKLFFYSGMSSYAMFGRTNRFVWYTNARGVDYGVPSGTTFCDEWNIFPFMDMDRDFDRMSKRDYYLNPNAAFRDYAGWWYGKMARSGAMDHLYWDDAYLKSCFDLVGTDCYVLPDGRTQGSCGVFDLREMIKRCATVQAEAGRDPTGNWVHMTNAALAPISSFAGVHNDMEEDTVPLSYQKKYPRSYLQAVSIGRQMGARVKVLGLHSKVSPEKDAWYERTGTGVMLTHELRWKLAYKKTEIYNVCHQLLLDWGYRKPDTRVWNYWNEDEPYPLSVEGAECATLALARNGEAVVVISDFSEAGGTFRIRPDARMMGIPEGFSALDLEDVARAVRVEDGVVVVDVKPCDFRMILLK